MALVQSIQGVPPLSLTLNSVAPGNLLIFRTSYYQPGSTTALVAPADTNGIFLGTGAAGAAGPTGITVGGTDLTGTQIYYQRNAAGGAHTVTQTINGAGATAHASLEEHSGLDTSAAVFATTQTANSGALSATQSRVSGTPAASAGAGDLVIASVAVAAGTGVANAGLTDPPASYTHVLVANDTAIDIATEFCYQPAAGGAAPNTTWAWTDASTAASQGGIAFFKAAPTSPVAAPRSSGPGIQPNRQFQFRKPPRDATALSNNVTIALTGVTAVGSVGSLAPPPPITAPYVSQPGPGVGPFSNNQFLMPPRSSTVVASTALTLALTGVSATGSVGSVAAAVQAALSAVSATGAPGTLVPAASLALSGVSGSGSVGSVVGALSAPLTAVTGTGSVGSVNPASSVPLTAVSATGSVGTVTASTGLTLALTGVSATGSVGTLSTDLQAPLTAVSATGSVGAVTPVTGLTLALTGVSATGSVGTVSPSSSVAVSGDTATGSVGTVIAGTPDLTLALTGVSATGSVGTVRVQGAFVPPSSTGAIGGGGASYRGSSPKEIARRRKEEEDLTEEIRTIYRRLVKSDQPAIAEKAEEIVKAANPRVDARRVSIAKLPPETREVVVERRAAQLKAVKAETEIALRLLHEELEIEEENERVINIIMQVI